MAPNGFKIAQDGSKMAPNSPKLPLFCSSSYYFCFLLFLIIIMMIIIMIMIIIVIIIIILPLIIIMSIIFKESGIVCLGKRAKMCPRWPSDAA